MLEFSDLRSAFRMPPTAVKESGLEYPSGGVWQTGLGLRVSGDGSSLNPFAADLSLIASIPHERRTATFIHSTSCLRICLSYTGGAMSWCAQVMARVHVHPPVLPFGHCSHAWCHVGPESGFVGSVQPSCHVLRTSGGLVQGAS